jgi:23S rRNA maturation mini-RNase III
MTTRDSKKNIIKSAENSKKPTKKSNVSSGVSKEDSLSNLSAIMAVETCSKKKARIQLIIDRILAKKD